MAPRGPLGIDFDETGPCLRALGVWLDPVATAPAAFVSHAHAAPAAAGSARVFASPETVALAAALGTRFVEPQPLGWTESREVAIDRAFGGGTARLTIAPAGHMLGAAQLVIDHPGGRLVYTGDFGADGDATHPPGTPVACDELVLTSAFALPIFRFEPLSRSLAALADWCVAERSAGRRPLVLARSPGPAQSIVRTLSARGIAVAAEGAVRRACEAYAALGADVGAVAPLGPAGRAASAGDAVILVAAREGETTAPTRATKTRVAYASGWALLDAAVEQKRADAAFPLGDQADYDGWRALVRATGARVVHATRGDAKAFARVLGELGIDADALDGPPIDARGES